MEILPIKSNNEKILHPITVKCVVSDMSDLDSKIQEVKKYAQKQHVSFILRTFSESISDDRNFIQRLPAFHIYEGKSYKKTFYLDTNPNRYIDDVVQLYIYKLREKGREKEKKVWNTYILNFAKSVKKLLPKKILTETS
jgi:hypothetical protein